MTILKLLSKRLALAMAKRRSTRQSMGKSMRNGNAPSPYTKYQKQPYVYIFKRKKVAQPVIGGWKVGQKERQAMYKQMAAE